MTNQRNDLATPHARQSPIRAPFIALLAWATLSVPLSACGGRADIAYEYAEGAFGQGQTPQPAAADPQQQSSSADTDPCVLPPPTVDPSCAYTFSTEDAKCEAAWQCADGRYATFSLAQNQDMNGYTCNTWMRCVQGGVMRDSCTTESLPCPVEDQEEVLAYCSPTALSPLPDECGPASN